MHTFSYPRVTPVTADSRRTAESGSAPSDTAPAPTQRDLVEASLLRCPPAPERR